MASLKKKLKRRSVAKKRKKHNKPKVRYNRKARSIDVSTGSPKVYKFILKGLNARGNWIVLLSHFNSNKFDGLNVVRHHAKSYGLRFSKYEVDIQRTNWKEMSKTINRR